MNQEDIDKNDRQTLINWLSFHINPEYADMVESLVDKSLLLLFRLYAKNLITSAEQRVAREIFKELRLYERDNKIYMDKNAGWTFQYCLNSDQFLEYLEELRKKYNVESGEGQE